MSAQKSFKHPAMFRVLTISFWVRLIYSIADRVMQQLSRLVGMGCNHIIRRQVAHWTGKGVLPVEIRSRHGLGAKLTWCVAIMRYCQEKNLCPQFRFTTKESTGAEDYFGSYFITAQSPQNPSFKFIRINDLRQLGFDRDYHADLGLAEASQLVSKYIHPRPEIAREVEQFVLAHFGPGGTLGVHYRGTDKTTEAPFVDYEKVQRNIEHVLRSNGSLGKVFLATDDQHFLEFMKCSSLAGRLCWRADSIRSVDGAALHAKHGVDLYGMNRDAVVNMLILARCAFLIKTASFLSSFSILMNPALPYMMLNQPYGHKLWFPERDMVRLATMAPVTEPEK